MMTENNNGAAEAAPLRSKTKAAPLQSKAKTA
jgi:hypothetical protein